MRLVRGQADRGTEGADRFVQLTAGVKRIAEVGMECGMVRIDRDGTTEEFRRGSLVSVVQRDDPKQVQGVGVLRSLTQNRTNPILGLIEPAARSAARARLMGCRNAVGLSTAPSSPGLPYRSTITYPTACSNITI